MTVNTLFSPRIALVGNPNCGKTALFNRLTGARQKVANYAGVTIERKEGKFTAPGGRHWHVLDLPGTYSLRAITPDEKITEEVITGQRANEALPDAILCVVDATNLKRGLRLALELKNLNLPLVLAVNMIDVAKKRSIHINVQALQQALGIPVVETVAVDAKGVDGLLSQLESLALTLKPDTETKPIEFKHQSPEQIQTAANAILKACVRTSEATNNQLPLSFRIDNWVLHPAFGPMIFASFMFLVFQAVFTWAQPPMDLIKDFIEQIGNLVQGALPDGMLQELLVKGVIGGAGSVLVFCLRL